MSATQDLHDETGIGPQPSSLRVLFGLAVAAFLAGLTMCVFVYFMAELTREGTSDPARVALDAAGKIFAYVFGFAVTLGFAAAKGLLAVGLRGPLTWSVAGAACGALAGYAYGEIAGVGTEPTLLIVTCLFGWAQMLIARRIGGVR